MIRHTRQEAKALGLPKCYGSTCSKHPDLGGLRRISGACVECAKNQLRDSRAANMERTREQWRKDWQKQLASPEAVQKKRERDAKYRKSNRLDYRATILAWSAKNPGKVKAYAKKTKSINSGRTLAHTVKRRLEKLHRTPKWLTLEDRWMIVQAYELAALRTKLFGFSWHVDHIIPLQGTIVSGFHTPYNLQVIPGSDNVRKSNKFEAV